MFVVIDIASELKSEMILAESAKTAAVEISLGSIYQNSNLSSLH